MDSRKCFQTLHALDWGLAEFSCRSGYVALAVVGDNGILTKDLNTGLGGDRSANMVAFAVEALKLVEDFIKGNGSSSGKM